MTHLTEFAEWLNRTNWLNLLFFFLAILGILLSVIFYRRSKKEVQPCFQHAGVSLLASGADSVRDLQILHKGTPIARLSVDTLSFWNEGSAVLESKDVASADPLRIVLPAGTHILQASLATQSVPSNNVRLSINDSSSHVDIEFDYLAKNEGFAVEIFHDAPEANVVFLLGTIKGKKIRRVLEGNDVISDTYVFPIFSKLWHLTGGPKRPLYWITAPIWILPLILTLILDLFLKPFSLVFGLSKELDAHKRISRLK